MSLKIAAFLFPLGLDTLARNCTGPSRFSPLAAGFDLLGFRRRYASFRDRPGPACQPAL
jgi:hypothetical protein